MIEAAPTADATIERVAPAADRERVDGDLETFLAESRRNHAENPHVRPMYDRAAEFVLSGGKRLRPRLALASYRIVVGDGETPPRPVRLAAASLELLHAFMLVHDDLIDESLVRRDRPTLHEAIRRDLPDRGKKRAADLGLIAGDLLCSLGMRMLARSGLDDAALGRAHRLVSDMLLETGVGEALDVLYEGCSLEALRETDLIDAYLRKTARYSVSGPLVLGATLAGADAAVTRSLSRLGDLLGLGYQIRNDLDALADAVPHEECPDLDGGKRTLVLWTAYQRLGETGREAVVEALSAPVGPERRGALLDLIASSGAIAECQARVGSLHEEALAVLDGSPLDGPQRRALLGLVELFGAEPVAYADAYRDRL